MFRINKKNMYIKYGNIGGETVSKLITEYRAALKEIIVNAVIRGNSQSIEVGTEGKLTIWESENLHPGERYIQFKPDHGRCKLQTSCGKIKIEKSILTICTHNDCNTYSFKLLEKIQAVDFKMKAPERFWHVCCSCGKEEILSSKEAFEKGWDYPGPDGIYKDMPNYGFCILTPRTCGDCSINKSLYWRLMESNEVNEKDKKTLERILNEPMSLIVDDDCLEERNE